MLLAADIGNTNITLGVFDGDNLIETRRIESDRNFSVSDFALMLQKTFEGKFFEACVISSVVDEITYGFKQACDKVFSLNSILLTPDMEFDFGLESSTRSTIGADRLANIEGALKYGYPAIVVDVGTAVTFDIIDKNKNFIGGVIMPGINIGLKALAERTSKLPEIAPAESPVAIGYDTETCILSGVVRGIACGIEGLLLQCENELGEKAIVIGTGGQNALVSKYMTRKFDYVEPNLTLLGLKRFWNRTSAKSRV